MQRADPGRASRRGKPRPRGEIRAGQDRGLRELVEACAAGRFVRVEAAGAATPHDRTVAVEAPIAIEVNGFGYAVLMATPADLDDLVRGFALTERLIDDRQDVADIDIQQVPSGWMARLTLTERVADRIGERIRHRTAESSCGLCGIENLEQAMRPLPHVREVWPGSPAAIFAAAAALPAHQPLNRATGAVHAAAWCRADGGIADVREDVGRHNAFDKLIGAMLARGDRFGNGFALLTSRCSYELVEKAVLAGCPMLATISAPTDLAMRRAREAGLALHVLVRSDALLRSA